MTRVDGCNCTPAVRRAKGDEPGAWVAIHARDCAFAVRVRAQEQARLDDLLFGVGAAEDGPDDRIPTVA